MIYYVLEKIFYILFKITLADKIKTRNEKIKVNQAQDNLDRKTAKISQLSCS